jgi:hypothetical protein
MRLGLPLVTLALLGGAGCADTTAPLPPPEEVLLVLNTGDSTLSVIPLSGAWDPGAVPLGSAVPADARPAAGERLAVVPNQGGDGVAVVNIVIRQVTRQIGLGAGAGVTGGVLTDDSTAYMALSGADRLVRVNLATGDTTSIGVGRTPKAVAVARGKLFVANANLDACPPPDLRCPAGESWITVVDPATGARATGRDSIPLPGSFHASYIAAATDGKLYVLSVGGPDNPGARLAIVDPVNRVEVGNFGGFGDEPGQIAADRGERIFVSSRVDGLMEFNTRTRTLTRGAGNGLPVVANSGVAVTSGNFILAVEAGACSARSLGRAREFRPDLTETRSLPLGVCAGAAAIALIPSEDVAAVP